MTKLDKEWQQICEEVDQEVEDATGGNLVVVVMFCAVAVSLAGLYLAAKYYA